jgi:hypothetical protein
MFGAFVVACHNSTEAPIVQNAKPVSHGTGSVTGIVTRGGKPLANALVVVETRGELEQPFTPIAQTAADGRFAIANVPAGEHAVEVMSDRTAFVDDARQVVTVTMGKPAEVALEVHAGRIEVYVSAQTNPGPALNEILMSNVFLFRGPTAVRTVYDVFSEYGESPALRGGTMASPDGMAIFHDIPAGHYTLCVSAARHPGPAHSTVKQRVKIMKESALDCRPVTVEPKSELEIQSQELVIQVPRARTASVTSSK